MISETDVKRILTQNFKFDAIKIKKLDDFVKSLLIYNKKRNLIAKSTEKDVWCRHVLDSAQLILRVSTTSRRSSGATAGPCTRSRLHQNRAAGNRRWPRRRS